MTDRIPNMRMEATTAAIEHPSWFLPGVSSSLPESSRWSDSLGKKCNINKKTWRGANRGVESFVLDNGWVQWQITWCGVLTSHRASSLRHSVRGIAANLGDRDTFFVCTIKSVCSYHVHCPQSLITNYQYSHFDLE